MLVNPHHKMALDKYQGNSTDFQTILGESEAR